MTKYLLEDISNLAHRVFFSLNSKMNLKNNEDFQKHRDLYIHTILNTIQWDRTNFKVDMKHTVLCFDSKHWRVDYLENNSFMNSNDYKDGRDQENKIFIRGLIESVYYITSLMNYIVLKEDRFEADDLIALFIKRHLSNDTEFLIVSNDDDFTQLKKYNTTIYSPNKRKFNDKDFSSVELKIIRGDVSDNIKRIVPKYLINSTEININFSEKDINNLINKHIEENSVFDRNQFKLIVSNYLSNKIIKKIFDILKKQLRTDVLKGKSLTAEVEETIHEYFSENLNIECKNLQEMKEFIENDINMRYNLNETLIDFNFIPTELVDYFNKIEIKKNNFTLENMKKTLKCFSLTKLSEFLSE